jgi:uracil-DNA glycosylase
MAHPEEIVAAVTRRLETDLLLGVRAVPLRAQGTYRPATRAAVLSSGRPAAEPVAANGAHLQALSEEDRMRRETALRKLDESRVKACVACGLAKTRTKTVFGQGSAAARLVFVGEAPGHDEDEQGLAFVGKAGQLLTKMIEAMGLTRDEVFICNILKCRPPQNRDPAPDEVSACWPYLDEQLRIINPEVIVTLGKPASQTLLRTTEGISRLRGQWHSYYVSGSPNVGPATPLMPTYHPAYLLRSPGEKAKTWSDLKLVLAKLGLPVPAK